MRVYPTRRAIRRLTNDIRRDSPDSCRLVRQVKLFAS
jgi:hypothetical protein